MKQKQSFNFRFFTILLTLFLFFPLQNYIKAQSVTIAGIQYEIVDGIWYNTFNGHQGDEIILSRLIVRLQDGGDVTLFDFGAFAVEDISNIGHRFLDGFYVLSIGNTENSFPVAQILEDTGLFDVIEFDSYGTRAATPNDPNFSSQWNLDLSHIQMEATWDYETGDNSIILAIIDNGVNYNHEDITPNIWQNLAEDADGDGHTLEYIDGEWLLDPGDLDYYDADDWDSDPSTYKDDLIGWDFWGDGTVPDNDPFGPGVGTHGTKVAGVAGGVSHNGLGISGIAGGWDNTQGIQLMILRDGGDPVVSLTAEAINYAANIGAQVINISTGYGGPSTCLKDAVDDAVYNHDVVIIASAGNSCGSHSTPSECALKRPARYSNTIAVGSTEQDDSRWYDSPTNKYGSCIGNDPEFTLDVMAPGGVSAIWSTDISGRGGNSPGSYRDDFGGTSASAPHVAGVVALMRLGQPDLTFWEVQIVISSLTAEKVDGMGGEEYTDEYGYGRVNAYYAVAPPATPTGFNITGSENENPTLHWNENSEPDVLGYKIYRKKSMSRNSS